MAEPNWQNRTLFHGDNLVFLRAMNSESVDLIATDPPFKKDRDFHAVPDSLAAGAKFEDRWSWAKDVHDEWVDQITDDWPKLMEAIESARYAHSDGMGAFMCFMAVRLLEMRRVLKPAGSIYLHCDHTASHYLKAVMDAIFGRQRFRNEIIWHYSGWNRKLKHHFNARHDSILFYTKTQKSFFNSYSTPWASVAEYVKVRKQKIRTDENGRQYVLSDAGSGKRVKRFLTEAMAYGKPVSNVWVIDKLNNSATENTGYPTQKPLPLYERIIQASTPPRGVVLDPFAGCATTLVAAEQGGFQWVGIDIWKRVHDVIIRRLELEGLLGNFRLGDIHFTEQPPARTDDGQIAAPYMKRVRRVQHVAEPADRFKTRKQKLEYLLKVHGPVCAGCDRRFDDPRYLELDHNAPRSTGGLNHTSNRILLCGPCNKLKSDVYTLKGLRKQNARLGYMAKDV